MSLQVHEAQLWFQSVHQDVPEFLRTMYSKKDTGFCAYSKSGDYLSDSVHWGLHNSVFFLKCVYTLNQEKSFAHEIQKSIEYIKTFAHRGMFYDPWITRLSLPLRVLQVIRKRNFLEFSTAQTKIAEDRQVKSTLKLYGAIGDSVYPHYLPHDIASMQAYLSSFDWHKPWHAASQLSHVLFYLSNTDMPIKDVLIDEVYACITSLQQPDGGWYQGNISLREKINGAMKILTGMCVANRMEIHAPKALIDMCLDAVHDAHACDNFNIVYVLKHAVDAIDIPYRSSEIEVFLLDRLEVYKKHYFSIEGGFSFLPHQANRIFYGALITRGKAEPDIHGTTMFLWGISLIEQMLPIRKKLFKEFIP